MLIWVFLFLLFCCMFFLLIDFFLILRLFLVFIGWFNSFSYKYPIIFSIKLWDISHLHHIHLHVLDCHHIRIIKTHRNIILQSIMPIIVLDIFVVVWAFRWAGMNNGLVILMMNISFWFAYPSDILFNIFIHTLLEIFYFFLIFFVITLDHVFQDLSFFGIFRF